MKNKIIVLAGTVVAIMLLFLGFGADKVYATTGCFLDTIGHPFETYICWMKDYGITGGSGGGNYSPDGYVTRGQMAVFMQRSSEVPPTKGDTYINVGPGAWIVDDTTGAGITLGTIKNYPGISHLGSSNTGTHYFMLVPSLPSSLYNTEMYVKGVKLCYDAGHGATINVVSLLHYSSGVIFNQISDYTIRSDKACSTFLMSNPSEFWGGDQVTLRLGTSSIAVDQYIAVTSATFILTPSAKPAVLAPVIDRIEPESLEITP